MRLTIRGSGLLAAAALAGAIVYWRAHDRREAARFSAAVDAAITEGRDAATVVGDGDDRELATV